MCNWFKKLFGGKCECKHCDHCEEKKDVKEPIVTNTPAAEIKPEASQEENVEKVQ